MLIQIHTDNHISSSDALKTLTEDAVRKAIGHHEERISRVEVHLGDENAGKGGSNDKRCMVEVRIKGLKSVAVTAHAESIDLAVHAATDKIEQTLTTTFDKLQNHHPH